MTAFPSVIMATNGASTHPQACRSPSLAKSWAGEPHSFAFAAPQPSASIQGVSTTSVSEELLAASPPQPFTKARHIVCRHSNNCRRTGCSEGRARCRDVGAADRRPGERLLAAVCKWPEGRRRAAAVSVAGCGLPHRYPRWHRCTPFAAVACRGEISFRSFWKTLSL